MSNSNYFSSIYQEFIYMSRYARFVDSKGRRENWPETITRYFDFFEGFLKENNNFDLRPHRKELEEAVLGLKVMPSMRALMTAGLALKRDPMSAYNCSFAAINNIRIFSEILYILMLGCGVGFSVESEDISNLPILPDEFYDTETTVVFEDSKLGWAKGLNEWLSLLSVGQIPKYNVSKIRKKGERLKIFGGRASGPEVLCDLLEFTKNIFRKAAGRKLTTIECHDIVCKIADVVICGGVRRSATISLSDLADNRMREAKIGAWWQTAPYRRLANNSAVYEEDPEIGQFMKEWLSLYESKSGERGIFSRKAAKHVIENSNNFRKKHFDKDIRLRNANNKWGVNPCSEILLRDQQLCNLTSVQIREIDNEKTLIEKIKIATILGTIQACLTKFKYVNKKWQHNCEDERLLGVSLNGIFDNSLTNGKEGKEKLIKLLTELKKTAIETNIEWAKKLGIPQSTAVTCTKPEGTTSALNGTSSGIHPAHSPYYVRYVRNDMKDPLSQFLIDSEIPYEKDHYDPNNMICFKFPMKSASTAIFRKDLSPIDHLELWKIYQEYYCVTGDTKILTDKGNIEIEKLFNKKTNIWNGFEWSEIEVFKTGIQSIFRVLLSDGSKINLTENHKFIIKDANKKMLKDCNVGDVLFSNFEYPIIYDGNDENLPDPYSQGFYSGDGYITGNWTLVYTAKEKVLSRLIGNINLNKTSNRGNYWKHSDANVISKLYVPHEASLKYKLNWLAGLIDSDGCKNGGGFNISSKHKDFLQNIKILLTSMGVKSKIYNVGPRFFGKYLCDPTYVINVSGYYASLLLKLGLITNRVSIIGCKNNKKINFSEISILEIEKIGEEETYCFTEKLRNNGVFNGILMGQCEHKPSVTISVKEKEWLQVGSWVYDNFEWISGVSFLPTDDHVYTQAPFTECSKEEYEELLSEMPLEIDWSKLAGYEKGEDHTTGTQTLACTGSPEGCFI